MKVQQSSKYKYLVYKANTGFYINNPALALYISSIMNLHSTAAVVQVSMIACLLCRYEKSMRNQRPSTTMQYLSVFNMICLSIAAGYLLYK